MTRTVALLICLSAVAWLTAAAAAVRSVSRIWLRHWVERQLRGAPSAEMYLERPQRLLLAASTGVAAIVFIAGVILGAIPDPSAWPLIGAASLFALAILFLGQLIPRALARRWPTTLIPVLLPLLRAVEIVLTPVVALSRAVARPLQRPATRAAEEEEKDGFEDLLREGELEGVGVETEIQIISGVVQFGQKRLGDIMTPREEIFALDEKTVGHELASLIAQSGYSRVPIYRGTLDDVIGMIHAFDVLKNADTLQPPLRPVASALATAKCNEFLFEMLRGRRHLAIVRDGAGRTIGLVTLEDLLEELVGDIRDEHDEPAAPTPAAAASGGQAPLTSS